jgi:tRNA pseudouridine13 synthase
MQLKTVPEDFVVVEEATHTILPDGPYALLELTKRNMTTEAALQRLAEQLGIDRKRVGYAGTKDSRALTRQHVTIPASAAARLHAVRDIAVRHLGFLAESLHLGDLDGNRFEIIVRGITTEELHTLQHVPNYFDEQRFSQKNAQIGKAIVIGDFAVAAELICSTDDHAEREMRTVLDIRANDYVTALRRVPRSILLMYVHAYQSSLFNEVLARYVRHHDPAAVTVDGPVTITIPAVDVPPATIPLIGFGTELMPPLDAWYEELLAREGITQRDFVVRPLPQLSVEGGVRDAFIAVNDLVVGPLEEDDRIPGTKRQLLTFRLPKAAYATMCVKCWYRTGRVLGGT